MNSNGADPRQALAALTGPGGEFEIAEQEVLGARMPVFTRRAPNLGALLAGAPAPGDREYLVSARRRLTYAEHAELSGSFAAVLSQRYGVGKGDRVAILAANCPEWIVAFWSTVRLGAICAAFNAWWSTPEIAYALEHARPTVLIADAERAAKLPPDPGIPVLSLETGLREEHGQPPEVAVGEDDPAAIVYTSGTTGKPKGVTHSHRNLVATANYHRLMKAMSAAMDPRQAEPGRWLLSLPLFHIASLHNVAVPRLATGETVVLSEGAFDARATLDLVSRERVTNWTVVPTMANRLVAAGTAGYDLSALKAFGLASAPSAPALQARLRELVPAARQNLVTSYGLTESGTGATVTNPAALAADPETVGTPIPTVSIQVRDDSGAVVPDGVPGEIWLRSQYNMTGYWNDEAATAAVFDADRWMRTGDIGCLRDGLLYLTTRRSDLILRGGENVYPIEIEHCLDEHPAVAESAVIGLDHADLGQEVCAIVVLESEADESALREYAAERLAYYKVPSRWHLTTATLPRNATGKVKRTGLRGYFGSSR
ncbi:class I adenylate-forming enzyme family protein [Amycolatopsis magusensis]|uniref:Acyl-CoA synthetase (AMP-forming)/AMP-acid ligase II n=1 Tax=Amycolatopsis magusensis TaxID=882444 RepID=A0ABS4PXE6_9PSEU|nr:class I adenylate-forming enzyme family protein [Amycolatopsis magusensis]MBP2183988.1 acyl-CoA synthetase (AMP-forming)/AMP-acid ligase II [Amycolatopsis magusensis]